MRNLLRNSLIVIGTAVALAMGFGIYAVNAQPSSINVQTTAVATSTRAFIGNGTATSTYQFDSYPTYNSSKVFSMAGIDSEYLYVLAEASTTSTVFNFTPQFSNNGTDWYGIASTTAVGTNGFAAGATVFTWTPGTVATSGLAFKLPDIQGMHERVVVSATGAAGAVYMEVVLKKNASGQ